MEQMGQVVVLGSHVHPGIVGGRPEIQSKGASRVLTPPSLSGVIAWYIMLCTHDLHSSTKPSCLLLPMQVGHIQQCWMPQAQKASVLLPPREIPPTSRTRLRGLSRVALLPRLGTATPTGS